MEVALNRGNGAVDDGGIEPEQEATERGGRRDKHDVRGRSAGRDTYDCARARLSLRHAATSLRAGTKRLSVGARD